MLVSLPAVLILAALSGAAVLLMQLVRFGKPDDSLDTGDPPPSREEMRSHVLWRSFYVNPADPRGWVPKPSGFGTTVNFRTRRNAAVFAAIAASTLAAALTALFVMAC